MWLYGLVEPMSGKSFFYEFCHLDSICFEKYLELFSEEYSNDFHIIQLDNGSFHQALNLSIPDNIMLLFQPPYTPQVNPIERLWRPQGRTNYFLLGEVEVLTHNYKSQRLN